MVKCLKHTRLSLIASIEIDGASVGDRSALPEIDLLLRHVAQDGLNASLQLWRPLFENCKRADVIMELFNFGKSTEGNGGVLVGQSPCQRKLGLRATKFVSNSLDASE